MIWTIIAILVALWLAGFILDVAGSLIHIVLVIALAVFIFNLITSRRKA
ncbi:MAG: lmo0937 family membrane protein [Coriobacteriia bacterium]|nr:lmo0937 family membrane protein [Coriobacteriia bacterium]